MDVIISDLFTVFAKKTLAFLRLKVKKALNFCAQAILLVRSSNV